MIVTDMLKITLEPTKKTNIMFGSNLSHAQLVLYLQLLIDKQLVESKDGLWVTTEKGKQYLERYHALEQIIA